MVDTLSDNAVRQVIDILGMRKGSMVQNHGKLAVIAIEVLGFVAIIIIPTGSQPIKGIVGIIYRCSVAVGLLGQQAVGVIGVANSLVNCHA